MEKRRKKEMMRKGIKENKFFETRKWKTHSLSVSLSLSLYIYIYKEREIEEKVKKTYNLCLHSCAP